MHIPPSTTISLNASDHPVKSVTIFQSSTAELTRTFAISLQCGRNVVEIANLSSRIDAESPRIYGLGAFARVLEICCDTSRVDTAASKQSIYDKRSKSKIPQGMNADVIAELIAKKEDLKIERQLYQQEYEALEGIVNTLIGRVEDPDHVENIMSGIVQRKRAAATAILEIDGRISELKKEIYYLGRQYKGAASAIVTATILAERACDVVLHLTYLVSGANWKPYYDLRARTVDGKPLSNVSLHYCANITQNTGEDWDNAGLTLSTANSQTLRSLSVPILDPLKISVTSREASPDFIPPRSYASSVRSEDYTIPSPLPVVIQQSYRYRGEVPITAPSPSIVSESVEDPLPAPPADADSGNPLSLAFRVGSAVSLPSNGLAQKVSVAVLDFTAELQYVCLPRQTEVAFIEASIKNTSSYELLAGSVSVFMDGRFLTKTSIGLISMNESFQCTLGIDNAVKVAYRQTSRTEQEPPRSFAEPVRTTTRTVTTTVSNNHQFDISPLIVRDALPLQDDRGTVQIMLRKPGGLAQAKDGEEILVDAGGGASDVKVRWVKIVDGTGGENDGTYEWVCSVSAGQKVELETEWDVKAPASVEWQEKTNSMLKK